MNDTESNFSISKLELLADLWGLEEFRKYLHRKKVYLYTKNTARLTRWLDRLTHFDIAMQHVAGSILKFTDYLSPNPAGRATLEDEYDEENVIIILSEQAKLN